MLLRETMNSITYDQVISILIAFQWLSVITIACLFISVYKDLMKTIISYAYYYVACWFWVMFDFDADGANMMESMSHLVFVCIVI